MTKHTLVPNNFYFMKPNKIVKKKISLLLMAKPIWIVIVHHLLWIKKKKKSKARSEDVHAFKNC